LDLFDCLGGSATTGMQDLGTPVFPTTLTTTAAKHTALSDHGMRACSCPHSLAQPSNRAQPCRWHLSAPQENVLFAPNRNLRLKGSGWRCGKTWSLENDLARKRPAGGAEEGNQEADQTVLASPNFSSRCRAFPITAQMTPNGLGRQLQCPSNDE